MGKPDTNITASFKTCKACGGGRSGWRLGVCRCCWLVDGDGKKHLVKHCSVCGVDLCRRCYRNPLKRILAFGKQFFQ